MNAIMIKEGAKGLALQAAKHAPEIAVYSGLCLGVVSTVMACKATPRAMHIWAEHQENLDAINDVHTHLEDYLREGETYTDKDYARDILLENIQTGAKLVRVYAPAAIVGVAGVALVLGGHKTLAKRFAGVCAAYTALDGAYSQYRNRVVEELGEEKDFLFANDLKPEAVEKITTDEKGKEKKEELIEYKPMHAVNEHSLYSRFFDESSPQWSKDPETNLVFLKAQQNYFNDLLKAHKHVFLNEVYDALGIPRSSSGAVIGWVLKEGNHNCIDFGLFNGRREKIRDFVNGYERSILLDFNVDGIIYDMI